MSRRISIIGGGNLGSAIAEGLISSGFAAPQDILITKRNIKTLQSLHSAGVNVSDNNEEALQFGEIIILAVKPFQTASILDCLKHLFNEQKHVVVSVVSAVTAAEIAQSIGKEVTIIRAMPNTAIAIQQSMTCLAGNKVAADIKTYVED